MNQFIKERLGILVVAAGVTAMAYWITYGFKQQWTWSGQIMTPVIAACLYLIGAYLFRPKKVESIEAVGEPAKGQWVK